MSGAALTPRVRTLVVCDEAVASDIEDGVFALEGVRYGFGSEAFPCTRSFWIYLLLTYPRGGRFDGEVLMSPFAENRMLRIATFTADFDANPGVHALTVEFNNCTFPTPGSYLIQVRFWTSSGAVLKKDDHFHVWQLE